jgi:hypothetical protein
MQLKSAVHVRSGRLDKTKRALDQMSGLRLQTTAIRIGARKGRKLLCETWKKRLRINRRLFLWWV